MSAHLDIFIDLVEHVGATSETLDKRVEALELSVRSYNYLKNANIRTVRELVQKTEADMLKTMKLSRKSLNEIRSVLRSMGPHLGMRVDSFLVDSQLSARPSIGWQPRTVEGRSARRDGQKRNHSTGGNGQDRVDRPRR